MSSNTSSILRIPQQFPNFMIDTPIQQKQEAIKRDNSNSANKQTKKKKKTSEPTSSPISKGGNSLILNNQYNLNYQNTQQTCLQSGKINGNNNGGENSFQNYLDWSNQQNNALTAPLKQQKGKQNNQLMNQNNIRYEKDAIHSQIYLENQQEINGVLSNKSNILQGNTNSLSSANGQLQQLQSNSKKKQSKQSKNQSDSSQKLSQSGGEQQQQQFQFENEFLIPNFQKKNNQGQFTDENKGVLQYDTKFSFNPTKIGSINNNSFNPYQNNSNINQNSSAEINNENQSEEKDTCPFIQLQQEIVSQTYTIPPVMLFTDEEPRYVNAAQFKRMMIMRIKRAARDLKQNKIVPQREIRSKEKHEQQSLILKPKKYKYESRHKHATNRIRDSKGRFIPKDQLQDYLEQLEREKREKECQQLLEQQKDDNKINTNQNDNNQQKQSTNQNIQSLNVSDQKYSSYEQFDETQQEEGNNQFNMEEEEEERKQSHNQLNDENNLNYQPSTQYSQNNNNIIQQQPTQTILPEQNSRVNQNNTPPSNNFTNILTQQLTKNF